MSTSFKPLLSFLFIAIVFVLSSCSDYNKVNLDSTKVKFDIKRQSIISPEGATNIYTLVGLSINDKEVKFKNSSIVVSPDSRQNIETENIGGIMIRINEEESTRSFTIFFIRLLNSLLMIFNVFVYYFFIVRQRCKF